MIDRIKKVMDSRNLSGSSFASEIGVQASSVSHVLSGRNKPSLEFIQKILKRYPSVDSKWLLTGEQSKSEFSFQNADNIEIDRVVVFFNNGQFKEYKAS